MNKKAVFISLISMLLMGCETNIIPSIIESEDNNISSSNNISINIIRPNISSSENETSSTYISSEESISNNEIISSNTNSSLDEEINNYYTSIDFSKSGDTLKNDLYNLIKKCNMPYSYDNCDSYIANANEDPNNPNNLIEFYTGRSVPKNYYPTSSSKPDAWNKEHVYAKSRGGFASQDAGKDIHHLMPTDNGVNNKRSSKDFDECTSESNAVRTYNSYKQSITVKYADSNDICYTNSSVFEPRDAVKGDVARILFYMATRYEGNGDGCPDLEIVDYTSSTSSPIIGKLSTLKKWHEEDPVDEFEMKRNNYIYSVQNNRNPYIDHPEIVSKIF